MRRGTPDEVESLYLLGAPVFADEWEAREHIRKMSSIAGNFTLNPVENPELRETTRRFWVSVVLTAPLF